MMNRRVFACSAFLFLAAPLWADPAAPLAPAPPSPAPLAQQTVLDGLVGKHRVIGFTERGGRKFLGRVISADHGLYVVQTFHYTSTPATVTETTPQTTTPQTTYRTGRNGRLRPVPRTVPRQVKTRETTPKTLADATAVRALLSGVAGPSFVPSEQPAQREIIAPADVTYLQELVPPVLFPAAPKTAADAAPKAASPGWTMKTLWASPDLPHPKTTK